MSSSQFPFFNPSPPLYRSFSTCSSSQALIFAASSFLPIAIILVFSVLIFNPNFLLSWSVVWVILCKSSLVNAMRSIISVNLRLFAVLPHDSSPFFSQCFNHYCFQKSGDSMHPCLTPMVTLNHLSASCPLSSTCCRCFLSA